MTRRPCSPPARVTAVLLAGPLLLGLSACGAGLDAQTYQTRTAADAANTTVGTVGVRNVRIMAPVVGRLYAEGSDAEVGLTLVSDAAEPDRLVEVSSPVASEVVTLVDGREGEIVVPAQGSTLDTAGLLLRGLTRELGTGENVPLTLRFETAGTVEVTVPVSLTGETDRPVGANGEGEGDPALGGPAGGHSEGEGGEPESAGEGEGG